MVYLQTIYEVFLDEDTLTIGLNQINPALDKLLKQYEQNSWALITAYNPYSQLLDIAQNQQRNQTLAVQLKEKNGLYLEAVGRDPQKQWPPEASFFVMGILQNEAEALGKRFAQNAILYGEINRAAQLLWLVEPGEIQTS